jgi:hypothetical protein
MSTAISTTVKSSDFAILDSSSEIAAGLADPNREAMDYTVITSVKMPAGGGVIWTVEQDGNVEAVPEITGILCAVQKHGVIWPTAEFSGGGSRPVVETWDLVRGIRRGDDLGDIDPAELDRCSNPDGTVRWRELSYTQPGSAPNGRGCRAKESRILYVLRPGELFPVKISAGPGSLMAIKPFLARMALPAYRHVVSLGLKRVQSGSGIAFSQIVPKIVDKLTVEQGEIIRQAYTLPLLGMAGGSSESAAADNGDVADAPF